MTAPAIEQPLQEIGKGEDQPCRDEECGGTAEVEVDGDHKFYVCNDCGFEFGYEKVQTPNIGTAGDSCAVGVPETIRRAASGGMEGAMAAEASKAPVPLTLKMPTG